MEFQVLGLDGSRKHTIELDDEVFGRVPSEGSVYHAVRNELANARVGTASTKTRGEVVGSKRKPWRQKGTGRARAGSRQSPIWVGGGRAFGPRPRDYSYQLPKKVKRLAYKSILSWKTQDEMLDVVEDFRVDSGKTKDCVRVLSAFGEPRKTVLVLGDDDALTKRAGRNIPWLTVLTYNRLRAHELFYSKRILLTESAAKGLNAMYGSGKAESEGARA